jgi:hypothetical protein
LGNKIKAVGMGMTCGTYGAEEKCIHLLVMIPEGNKPLASPRHRWKDNIKVGLRMVG